MKTIKVKFVDFYKSAKPETDFIARLLKKRYCVEFSDEPDYLFFSVFGDEHLKYNDCVKVFFTGECVTPDFNLCDYAIGFDYLDYGDRYFRFPIFYPMQCAKEEVLSAAREKAIQDFGEKNKDFCSFVYSNGKADMVRDRLFDMLNDYRPVSSGGGYRNNVGGRVADKIKFQENYKFCIACENAAFPGYTTEKLVQAFESGAIPIYWGDPCVDRVFNKKAFINCSDFNSLEELVEYVKYIDTHDDSYLEMLSQPIFLSESDYSQPQFDALEEWLAHIVEQSLDSAKRYSRGYFNCLYQNKIRRNLNAYQRTPKQLVKRLIKPIYYKLKGS